MNFEKLTRIPLDRVGVLIGKSGGIKSDIESACSVRLDIDSQTGQVAVRSTGGAEIMGAFKALEMVNAIGRGFSPDNAMQLLQGENTLHIMDISAFGGKSKNQIERMRGRLIGEKGKARRNIENLSHTHISIYGRTVSIIGSTKDLKLAADALASLLAGSMHGAVYGRLESARRKARLERTVLWENQNVF